MKEIETVAVRCAIYSRYSSDLQFDRSIDDQIRNCKQLAKNRGWTVLEKHVYADRAKSGTTVLGRSGLQDLISASVSKPRPFDYVLIDDTSRLSRDKVDQGTLIRDLKDEGIYVLFVSDGIDTKDETTEDVLLPVYGIKDALYSRDLARKTQRGMAGQVLKGFNAGGRLYGYGYTSVFDPAGTIDRKTRQVRSLGTRIEVDEEQAKIVRMIFAMYASGHGMKAIAFRLNEMGVDPPRRSVQENRRCLTPTWGMHTIRAILHNPKYFGDWTWNRKRWHRKRKTGKRVYRDRPESEWIKYKDSELAIIDADVWEAVQLRVRENAERFKRGERTSRRAYLLSGLIKCGVCGGNLIGVRVRNSEVTQYGCSFNWHRGVKACPNHIRIKRSDIEERVIDAIKNKILHPETINRLVELVNERLKKVSVECRDEWKTLACDANKVEVEIQNLVQFIAESGDISSNIATAIKQKEAVLVVIKEKLDLSRTSHTSQIPRIEAGFVVNCMKRLGELLKNDVVGARNQLERLVGTLTGTPVTYKGTTGLMFLGKPKLEDVLGLVEACSTSIGSGGRI